MALYDLVRCDMPLPDQVACVLEWRTKDLRQGLQTYLLDADGALRLSVISRQMRDGHPPRPALLDPAYLDWLNVWTALQAPLQAIVEFSGSLKLEGRDGAGTEWVLDMAILDGRCVRVEVPAKPKVARCQVA